MIIEAGKTYKTRDGGKAIATERSKTFRSDIYLLVNHENIPFSGDQTKIYHLLNGQVSPDTETIYDLIAEWTDEDEAALQASTAPPLPVSTHGTPTITPLRMAPAHGWHGIVKVKYPLTGNAINVAIDGEHTPEELRKAANTLNQIAEYLEGQQ